MLPAPNVSSPPTQVTLSAGFIGGGHPYSGTADAVQYGAWRAPSGEVGIILVNITGSMLSATIPVDFDRLKLVHGATYEADIESSGTSASLGQLSDTKAYVIPLQPLEIAVVTVVAKQQPNYQGLWWASPAGSESGWGINFAHQGDIIFATWFTYDTTGKAWWLSMTATKTAPNVYSGALVQTHGPAFSAMPFDPGAVTHTVVGNATLTFTDANTAQFTYTVNGVAQAKTLVREAFGALPTCAFGTQPNLALATNYQDLWWASPAGSESGWGINLTEQSGVIFGTWFTYDVDGSPLWLSVTATNTAPGIFTGTLVKTSGPSFSAMPFDPNKVMRTEVGSATFAFRDGANATFSYTVGNVNQVKSITREVFVSPGTTCR
ncbi:MAG TPA: hypothetical protein VJ891_15805, partial [Casimicrobiaceae bacterium]|nr:hypothetical protein [Casimicrobiaceae bacterium]